MKLGKQILRTSLLASAALAAASSVAMATPAGAQSAQVSKPKPVAHAPAGKNAVAPLNFACGTNGPDRDSDTGRVTENSKIRSGSSTGCTALALAVPSDTLNYRCFTLGNDGHTWTNLTRGSTTGWIRDDLLNDGGSFLAC
jgi:hypothetical protein